METQFKNVKLSKVCEVIEASFGFHFPEERWNILCQNLALAAGEFGFKNLDEFINWFLTVNLNKNQIETLAPFLVISETFFWREPKVFTVLTDIILPELVVAKKNNARNIRIWSAGCSTGEEAYSLAVALHKTIPNIKDWNIKILATDINQKALKKATAGIYTKWSFRNCPSWLISKYFHYQGNETYEILPEIKNMVTFVNLNLIKDIYPSSENDIFEIDMIFCRNVLMYLTDKWFNKILQNFYHSLVPNGWFVVSSCELSSQNFLYFEPVNFSGTVLYKKSNNKFSSSIKIISPDLDHDLCFPKIVNKQVSSEPPLDNQSQDQNTSTTLNDLNEKQPIYVRSAYTEITTKTATIISKIRLLADQSYLDQALSLCNEGIAADKLSISLYYLRAAILQEINKPSEAIESLKQSIYVDQNFIMGHFALGNLFIQQGKSKIANKYFKNVIDLLETFNDNDILPESDGLSVKYIREIIKVNKLNYSFV